MRGQHPGGTRARAAPRHPRQRQPLCRVASPGRTAARAERRTTARTAYRPGEATDPGQLWHTGIVPPPALALTGFLCPAPANLARRAERAPKARQPPREGRRQAGPARPAPPGSTGNPAAVMAWRMVVAGVASVTTATGGNRAAGIAPRPGAARRAYPAPPLAARAVRHGRGGWSHPCCICAAADYLSAVKKR